MNNPETASQPNSEEVQPTVVQNDTDQNIGPVPSQETPTEEVVSPEEQPKSLEEEARKVASGYIAV